MTDKYLGALFQDNHFIMTEFAGLKLERIIVCENPETKNVIIVYIKVKTKSWHQFFLESGCGFWQNHENIDPTENSNCDDDFNYVDKTLEFDLLNKIILNIWCEPHESNSQIIIEFENKTKLLLRTITPEIFDSNSELILIKP